MTNWGLIMQLRDDQLTGCDSLTGDERITAVARVALAQRNVVRNEAGRVDPADSETGIFTFLADAGKPSGTLGVYDTLRLAGRVGIAHIVGDTLAGGGPVPLPTLCIGAAGRRAAWPDRLDGTRGGCKQEEENVNLRAAVKTNKLTCARVTTVKRVSDIPGLANTDRNVISDPTIGIGAAEVGTRI